jgi:hypothetical protein
MTTTVYPLLKKNISHIPFGCTFFKKKDGCKHHPQIFIKNNHFYGIQKKFGGPFWQCTCIQSMVMIFFMSPQVISPSTTFFHCMIIITSPQKKLGVFGGVVKITTKPDVHMMSITLGMHGQTITGSDCKWNPLLCC